MNRRVVVTGLGIYSSAGKDLASFKSSILAASRSFSVIPHKELAGFGKNYAALVDEYPDPEILKDISYPVDPVTKLATEAAVQALNNSGLDYKEFGKETGMIVATCSGPMLSIEKFYSDNAQRDSLPKLNYNSITNTLTDIFGIKGFTTTVTTACSAGSAAAGIAADLIREGSADRMIVGGADTFSPTTFAGFFGLKAVSEEGSTPFSEKTGMTLGEAGAFIILEDLNIAEKRGANIISEVAGFGLSNDAFHCSAPDNSGKGQSYAMARALESSGVENSEVSYINAHGTGTAANDRAETKAVKRVFGDAIQNISMSSTKSMVGHCLGAAGIVEMIASFCAAGENVLPVTAGFTNHREGCDIDPVAKTDIAWNSDFPFMNNNFAFGGNNASIILSKNGKLSKSFSRETNDDAIVITGVGVISSAGVGAESLLHSDNNKNEFTICDFNERDIDRRLDIKGMDRSSRYATSASKLALINSKFRERPKNLKDLGIILGLSTGTTSAEATHIEPLIKNGFSIDKVQNFPYVVPNSIQGNVCRSLHLQGHNTVITSGKNSSHEVLRLGESALKSSHSKQVLCGAVNEVFVSDPVHENPAGEGAAVVMLESFSSAKERGAKPLGEIIAKSFFFCKDSSKESQFSEEIKSLLEKNMLKTDNICAISTVGEINKLNILSNVKIPVAIDLTDSIGDTESVSSLMNLSYLLYNQHFDIEGDKNYILSLSSDEDGANSVFIIKKFI